MIRTPGCIDLLNHCKEKFAIQYYDTAEDEWQLHINETVTFDIAVEFILLTTVCTSTFILYRILRRQIKNLKTLNYSLKNYIEKK